MWRLSHEWVVKNGEWKPLVQSYLACVSFVDHQVGQVAGRTGSESLTKDNTLIVLYSDHGFHLGRKGALGEAQPLGKRHAGAA